MFHTELKAINQYTQFSHFYTYHLTPQPTSSTLTLNNFCDIDADHSAATPQVSSVASIPLYVIPPQRTHM